MSTAIDRVLEKYGFAEDTDPVSTLVFGGKGLAGKFAATAAGFDPSLHPREPEGSPIGGRFASKGAPVPAAPAVEDVPEFGSQAAAEAWFRGFGIPDVNLGGIEDIPHGLEVMRDAARALVHEAKLHPEIVGENGLKAVLLSSADSRLLIHSLTTGANFEMEGLWATTFPYPELIDPLSDPGVGPYPSVVVLNTDAVEGSYEQTADMAANGMAVATPEQAFAHELGHVQANALGWIKANDTYMEAVASVENEMAVEAGVFDFQSQAASDGIMTDPLAEVIQTGVSPYGLSSPQEAYAEHFVRRTYPDSYGRVYDPEVRVWADRIADEYNRLAGGSYL